MGSGTFSGLNGLSPGNGVVLVPVYSSTNVVLVAAIEPTISSPVIQSNQIASTIPTTAGLTNVIEYTGLLAPPHWQTLATISGDGTTKVITDTLTATNRFFRTRFQ